MIHHGDCLEVMATMPADSVDAIVTDPPYGLSFMGKAWDHGVPAGPFWAEMLRVAKPGAYLLAFGGTRTVHRIATNIEDAGWVIRDTLVWCYASGFPKGRANLKPAWEPIVMARKPGPLRHLNIDECRIPGQWSTWQAQQGKPIPANRGGDIASPPAGFVSEEHSAGRWPANVILTDPIFDGTRWYLFDRASGNVVDDFPTFEEAASAFVAEHSPKRLEIVPYRIEGVVGGGTVDTSTGFGKGIEHSETGWRMASGQSYDEVTTYSRFFLIPKADRTDREPVLRGLAEQQAYTHNSDGRDMSNPKNSMGGGERKRVERGETAMKPRANTHPTVKPTDLMRHLVRLVTPSGGTVLDPFLGSGTTAIACELEGFPWIGIEKEAEYVAIAEARLNGVQRGLGLDVPAPTKAPPKTHPELSKHQPKRRAAHVDGTIYGGGWTGTDEEPAA